MTKKVDLYDSHYGHLATSIQTEVRRETYGEDLGQASWITLEEALDWFALLGLGPGRKALEVACGSGGVTLRMATETGAVCVGVDINVHGIDAANQLAVQEGLSDRVSFTSPMPASAFHFQTARSMQSSATMPSIIFLGVWTFCRTGIVF